MSLLGAEPSRFAAVDVTQRRGVFDAAPVIHVGAFPANPIPRAQVISRPVARCVPSHISVPRPRRRHRVGSALHEATEIDETRARHVNDNLADYLVPVNADTAASDVCRFTYKVFSGSI